MSGQTRMDCETLLRYLSDYIDRNLETAMVEAAQEHLAICANCRVVLDTTQQTILLYREQKEIIIPAERRQALWEQISAAFEKKKRL